jgi:hypothetical protein
MRSTVNRICSALETQQSLHSLPDSKVHCIHWRSLCWGELRKIWMRGILVGLGIAQAVSAPTCIRRRTTYKR